ncbi:hypothetical protein PSEUBRA_004375 [Kalmanozyma brasiliensis GHG001]|uniref:uncharacterized protein n=1 Tax=Kalmanozyma brasiliensis (strain GHG001) TaxID=1365824 RepID=UPI0028683252|nr:uncharacterized protein PSEUBRA_004375 [Kalmanozyma brasiliensis GHG001]KAF6767371.1 hypothetical protein PSEUBRA_004375 [Kalmanozyma brasiliensis GHG001]
MMEGTEHDSESFDFELERLRLLGESHAGRSEEERQALLRTMTLKSKKRPLETPHQSKHAVDTGGEDRIYSKADRAGEVVPKEPQHRYTLRPRSVYLNHSQRAVILAWLHDVEEADLGPTSPALSYKPTKLGQSLPLTTRRLAEHQLSSNGGMRSCQALVDASECRSSSDHNAEPQTSLFPVKHTSVAKRGVAAGLPSSLIMSKSHTVDCLSPTKQAVGAKVSDTKADRAQAERSTISFGSSPLTSLTSSCRSSPVDSPPTSDGHTQISVTKSAQVTAKSGLGSAEENGRSVKRIDDKLPPVAKEKAPSHAVSHQPTTDHRTSADRLFDLIAKLNE